MAELTSPLQALEAPEPAPDPWQLVGSEFEGGITVESVVGVGGFGTVYRAYHRHFRAPVALKVLRCPDGLTPSQRRDLLQRFEQETVVLFRLSRLTLDVASCLAAGTFVSKTGETTPYIVQEWLEGDSLDHVLAGDGTRRRYGLQAALELLSGPLRALLVAHEQGVVHRDIKPSNILVVSREGCAQSKLLDFGIAKLRAGASDSSVSEHGASEHGASEQGLVQTQGFRFLSVEYAAPEQWDETLGRPSARTDLFSLALVLVEMLCGHLALKGRNPHALMFAAMHPSERPTPRSHGADVPNEIEDLLASALAVRPEDRPASLDEWWQNLQAAARAHAAWSAAPPRVTEPLDATVLAPPGAIVFPDTGPVATPASVSSPAPPVVTGSSVAVPRQSTTAFYDAGDLLTREAARQRRRQVGLWVTSTTVGAAAVLATASTWKLVRRDHPALSVISALTPADGVSLDEPTSATTGSVRATLQHVPQLQPTTPSSMGPVVVAPVPTATAVSSDSIANPEPQAAVAASDQVVPPDLARLDVAEGSTRPAQSRPAQSRPIRPTPLVGEAPAVVAFAPVSPGGVEEARSPSAATGELRLNSIPPSAIVIDGRPIGSTPKANVHLSPGSHNVTFIHPELGKRKLLVLVESGKSQTLSVKF